MNSPKVPNDVRNWTDIDIFLFSNGQQHSPPRKYHLKLDELNNWSAIQLHLAHSQFGQMEPNIELYTLNGRKIDAPLELMHDSAYVAVKPPDAFIQTGYEKYLLKASRSREKRHEKLNSYDKEQSGNTEIERRRLQSSIYIPSNNVDNNSKNLGNIAFLDTETNCLPTAANNTITQSQNKTEVLHKVENINNSVLPYKPEILQKEKLICSTKNTILKKISHLPAKNKFSESISSKRKNHSFTTNILPAKPNIKRVTTPFKNTANIKPNDVIAEIEGIRPKSQTVKNVMEKKEITDSLKDQSLTINSEKDLTVLSDVYKNTESDIQSFYLDADRKTVMLANDKKKTSDLTKSNNSEETSRNSLKNNNVMTKQNAVCSTDMQETDSISSNQPGSINLHLNVDFKGCAVYKTFKTHVNKYIKVMKPGKASQVDNDVTLSNDKLNRDNDTFNQDKSLESIAAKICEENILDTDKKVLVVHCKCDLLKRDRDELPANNHEQNHSYILLIPAQLTDNILLGCDRESSEKETSDKHSQQLLQSCIRPPSIAIAEGNKKNETTKHKVSISQDAPEQINPDSIEFKSQGDIQRFKSKELKVPYKMDKLTQTNWCNVLLQAIPHEDGHYTFHLPPLQMLSQYNINF